MRSEARRKAEDLCVGSGLWHSAPLTLAFAGDFPVFPPGLSGAASPSAVLGGGGGGGAFFSCRGDVASIGLSERTQGGLTTREQVN